MTSFGITTIVANLRLRGLQGAACLLSTTLGAVEIRPHFRSTGPSSINYIPAAMRAMADLGARVDAQGIQPPGQTAILLPEGLVAAPHPEGGILTLITLATDQPDRHEGLLRDIAQQLGIPADNITVVE